MGGHATLTLIMHCNLAHAVGQTKPTVP